jgi:hypothetical protein
MKTIVGNIHLRFIGIVLGILSLMVLSAGQAYCQDENKLTFIDCKNYEDSCLFIGKSFIDCLSDQNFDDLVQLFSGDIFFRALIPSSIVTLNDSYKTADKLKSWFYNEEPEKYEIVESSSKVLVDCLHINYTIFLTYKGNPYNVEQQLYCEIDGDRISKLSLICSGFRSTK